MRKFRDTENGEILTLKNLQAEYERLKADDPETYDYTFLAYIENCTSKNGFLEEV